MTREEGTTAGIETLLTACWKRRRELGLTQEQVSHLMDRSPAYVGKLEAAVYRSPNLSTFLLWVFALGGEVKVEFPDRGSDHEGSCPSVQP